MDDNVMTYESLKLFADEIDTRYTKLIVFDITTPSIWNGTTVELSDERFLSANKYIYLVFPSESSRDEYIDCDVHPKDITIDGQMLLVADKAPSSQLTITILRFEVQ